MRERVLRPGHVFAMCIALVSLCGCKNDEVAPADPASTVTEKRSADDSVVGPARETAGPESDSDSVQLVPRAVRFGAGGATLSANGGTIVAGDSRLDVPSGAMREPGIIQIESFAASDVAREAPRGLMLAAGSSEPANLGLTRVAKFYVPLQFEIPEESGDVELELLSWHPALGTWLTTSYAEASAGDDTVLFYTDYIGDFVVRVRARWDDDRLERCEGDTLNMGEAIPANEDRAVGITAVGDRLNRSDAFAVLSDGRIMGLPTHVSFKNEEQRDLPGRISADERDHQDEDFLMDPQVAESLRILGDLSGQEWRTYFTDEPAYDLRITEAFDSLGEHRDVSTHYQGRALDLTLTPVPRGNLATRRAFYGRLTRLAVCAGFGYSLFENRFHVHVSSASTRVAILVENTVEDSSADAVDGGWSVWLYDFSHPDEPRRLYVGNGEIPARISWSDDEQVQLWTVDDELYGLVTAAGQFRRSAEFRAEYQKVDELGQRAVRMVDGRAFLVSAGAHFSPGTTDSDGQEVVFAEPVDITPRTQGAFVRGIALRESVPLRRAKARYP